MDISTAVATDRPVELRAAVRFPLCVPITICTEAGDLPAVTENISANGVLFEVATPLVVGSIVSFTIAMPSFHGQSESCQRCAACRELTLKALPGKPYSY